MISFGKKIVKQSLAVKPTLAITRFDIRRNRSRETFRRKSNLIRDRQILHFCQSKKTFRIGKLSHSLTLSFFGFGLFRETNSAHAVMTSSRLHFTLDKTALTCCIHSLKDMHTLQSAAIRSSCTQSLGVDFSPTTPREAFAHSAGRVHARTVKLTRAQGGRVVYAMSIQSGNMIVSHMSIRIHITLKPIRDHT